MSVAPDLLLKSAPEIKPKASVANAPAKPAEPNKNEASSFAQVYAKERQAKAAERSDAAAKSDREAKSEASGAGAAPAAAAAEPPPLADSGKSLPNEPVAEDAVIDPLLLLGMSGQPPLDGETAGFGLAGEAEPLTLPASSLVSSGPAGMTEASFDPELDALNQLPAVRMALELGAKAKAAAEQSNPSALAAQTTVNAGQSFASAMAAMSAQQPQAEAGELTDLPLIELTAEGLEALKESAADTRPENFVSKLSALSQAVGQQAALTARAPLIPGQPVPMQQAGWSEAVVDRVMLLSSQNLKSAEIQLDPVELGRLEVRISLNQDQTQVTFASANAGVREALEGQMHRLRELFTQQGMNLLDVNVSDQSLSRGWQGQENDGKGRGSAGNELLGASDEELATSSIELTHSPLSGGRGMVDYYA